MKFFEPLKTNVKRLIKANKACKLLEDTESNIKFQYTKKDAVINLRKADDDMSDMGLEVIHIEIKKATEEKFSDYPFVLDIHEKHIKDSAVFSKFLSLLENFDNPDYLKQMTEKAEKVENGRGIQFS